MSCKERGEEKVIAFNLSGHGHFDMGAYDDYLADRLPDYEYSTQEVERALAELPA
jgi:tryptophan synthase beta chain